MKKKYLIYAMAPVLALAIAGTASANGLWRGFDNATPQEVADQQAERFQEEADLLGVDINEVKSAWAQGKDLRELATEKGISEEALRTKLEAARLQTMKDHLKILVDQGVITQAQADQRLQVMQQAKPSGRMGRGMHGMRGGYRF